MLRATACLSALALVGPASAFAGQTIVSLTFDDGWDTQAAAAEALGQHGMNGTFYVNSPTIGTWGSLSWQELRAFDARGHEIGGHTLQHPDLTFLTSQNATQEVCTDRANLQGNGFLANSFAYPYGAYDSTTSTGNGTLNVAPIVSGCGYSSGRGAYGLHNIRVDSSLPYSTAVPPANVFKIRTPCCINHSSFGNSTPTAAALEDYVSHAEAEATTSNRWLIFVFHRICDNCGGDNPAAAMSPAEFQAFLDWLQPRQIRGTVVRTVAQVIKNDNQAPTSSIACNGLACSSGWYRAPVTVSLSASDTGTAGVATIRYTTDGSEPTVASPVYTGPLNISSTTTLTFRAWDAANNVEAAKSKAIQIDTTAPTSAIACDGSACASTQYQAPVSVTLSATDLGGSGVEVIRYTTDGSTPTASSTAFSDAFTVSTTTTIKFRAWDNAGNVEATNSQLIQVSTLPPPSSDTQPPTSSITCNGSSCASGWYSTSVSVGLSATDDDSGVAAIRYTTDGSEPTVQSSVYTGPFSVASTSTVKFRAWDNAGNVEATNSQLIQIDITAPSVVITSPADGSNVKGNVKIAANATDNLSEVVSVRFYVDGVLVGTKTGAPFFFNWQTNKVAKGQHTLTAVAVDAAGNESALSPAVVVTV
jgi:peptidoglycan/xylan/chitin deacetylase (PgdA/CDA1 family)